METLTFVLTLLGVFALAGTDLLILFWIVGVVLSVRRERKESGVREELVRRVAEVKQRDHVIATMARELDALHAEARELKHRMGMCGISPRGRSQ